MTEYVLQGSDAKEQSAGAVVNGTALELAAQAGGFEYALYRFNAPGLGSPGALDSVSVLLDEAATDEAWIGIADFDKGAWEFSGPYSSQKTQAIDDARYVSSTGDVWVAVLVAAGRSATVNALSVRVVDPANQPPTAALSADPLSGNAPLTVSFDAGGSSDSDGQLIEYAWDFDGNGTYEEFSDGPQVAHDYATAGLRTVKVRVTDDQFTRSSATVDINVNLVGNQAPLASFTRTPASGDAPLQVSFDGAASSDADGTIVRYDWDFDDDGIWDAYDSGPAVSYTYVAGGAFQARLRVTDDAGAQHATTQSVNVSIPGNDSPLASLSATPDQGDAPLLVTLDASGSSDPDGSIVNYEWDFTGNGSWDGYSDLASIDHTYAVAGQYYARVRVTDDAGAQDITSFQIDVNVAGNDAPLADFSATPDSGHAPQDVDFDAGASSDSDGTIVRYDWDFDNDGIWDAYDAEATVSHTYGAGTHVVKLRVTDDAGAQDSTTLDIAVNAPPVAVLTTDTPAAEKGETVYVDASESYDPDNGTLEYLWDIDGDGLFNNSAEDLAAYNDPTVGVVLGNTAGERNIKVAVNDDPTDPAQDTAEITLTTRGWLALTVRPYGSYYTSLAVINGKPAISLVSGGDLVYTRSSTVDGSGSWSGVTVEDEGWTLAYCSLSEVNGKPAISYQYENSDLKYAYSSTADGSSGWTNLTIDSAGNVGTYTSLSVVNGKPAISYGYNDGNLKYAYSSTADGSSGWTTLNVDSTGDVGNYTSLAVINGGIPAISYYADGNYDLKYAYSSSADGSSGWTALTVDTSPGYIGTYTSLAEVNGKPAISYRANDDLKYAYSSSPNGSSGWTAITVDSASYVELQTSLAVINGKPAISYYDDNNGDLKYAYSSTSDGSAGWTITTVDSAGDVGWDSSLAEVDGKAAISYYDYTNSNLKYAVLYQ